MFLWHARDACNDANEIAGPDREVYIYNNMPVRLDDSSYITEIQYPVEKTNIPHNHKEEHP